MKSIIVDSSSLVALANKKDSTHKRAKAIITKFKDALQVVIPTEVFAETLNIIGKKVGKFIAVNVGEKLLLSDLFDIVESTHQIRIAALKKFKNQPRSVSFTDCIVMAFADAYGTKEIFGFDETFTKNGYVRIGDTSEVI